MPAHEGPITGSSAPGYGALLTRDSSLKRLQEEGASHFPSFRNRPGCRTVSGMMGTGNLISRTDLSQSFL